MKIKYIKIVEEGTPYQIGYNRGEMLQKIKPLYNFMSKPDKDMRKIDKAEALKELDFIAKYDEALKEELLGFADGMKLPIEDIVVLQRGIKHPCGCTVIGVLPMRSIDNHAYLARSYEFGRYDEFIYSVTRSTKAYHSVGFSLFQVGRFEGLNEHGLAVSMASLEFLNPSKKAGIGLSFAFVIRILLDKCRNIQEALALIEQMPIGENTNIILMDKNNEAVIVEVLNCDNIHHKTIVKPYNGIVFGVNHYLTKENQSFAPVLRYFSNVREEFLNDYFKHQEKVSKDDLKAILSTIMPNGVACLDIKSYFGTLRSLIFDLTDSKLEIRLGGPNSDNWFTADINDEVGISIIDVDYEAVEMPKKYWELTSPNNKGENNANN